MNQPGSCECALPSEGGDIMDSILTHNATHQQSNHRQQTNCTHGAEGCGSVAVTRN